MNFKIYNIIILCLLLTSCGDTRPLKERGLNLSQEGNGGQNKLSKDQELSPLQKTKKEEITSTQEEGGLYLIVKNYLIQKQDELNIQLHQSKESRHPSFVLSENIKFGHSQAYYLNKKEKNKLGNYVHPRVLSRSSNSYVFWHCSYEGQNIKDAIGKDV